MMKKASEIIKLVDAQRAAERQAISRHLDNLQSGKYGRPLSRDAKKNTPDNSVLFPVTSKHARPQNNHGAGIGSHFNTTIQESDNPHSVERRNLDRMRIPSPECRRDVPPIMGKVDSEMLRRAKLKRIAQDGPNSNDTAADVLESGWKARDWTETLRERFS